VIVRNTLETKKKYSISENKRHIRIIGNGNKIYITNNSGTVEIIGNSTIVQIMNNRGSLMYTGNNGKIYLCAESLVTSVKYTGNNGSIKLVPRDQLLVKKTAKVISPPPLQRNHLNHDDCSNLFDRKFNKFTENNFFDLKNVSMPNLRVSQLDLGATTHIINISKSNIVINRN